MVTLVNRAKMTTSTTGTGTITLGSATSGYQTFAVAGVSDGDVVRYVIEDGDAWEIGLGTYSSGTLTRGSIESSNADSPLNLTGNAVVYASIGASDLQELVDFADNFVLPTADGSTGQVLTTNGAGTLSFTTISGYTDADVDTHLNTGTAASGEVLSWTGADYDWVAAPAALTGQTDSASPFETSLGVGAGAVNTGVQNTFIGFEAGNDNTSGEGNTSVGYQSADAITTGGYNAAFGVSALGGMTTGFRNVAVGAFAGASLTGNDNTVVGPLAYDAATLGSQNVAIGRDAMGVTTSNVSGNVAVGYKALEDVASDYNVAVGWSAGLNITSGTENVAIGYRSLDANTTGLRNVGIGSNALGALTTGANNVAIGNGAGDILTTGGNNIVIGNGSDASSATISNEITLGNSSITTLRCQVTTITSLSDARDKTDIQPLNAGLEFVEALNPVSFTWNMRDGGKVGEADTGFIAQDLQSAQAGTGVTIPGLVYDVNPDKLEAGYGKLIPVLVQAIKDLSAGVKTLKAQLEAKS